ncbi:MAG: SURF1 family protein [Pseudobdellovibrionaceae bacterium]|jgi:surfeit locus 1 family protein|nr:SURF1 family protein [Pseudobdellovibrionaceae bacterium]
MDRKFPIIATLVCLLAAFLLLALGFWQVQRLSWKENLQSQLDSLMSRQDLSALHAADFRPSDPTQLKRGMLSGTILYSKALYLNGYVVQGRTAFPVVVPVRPDGDADHVIAAVLFIERTKDPEKWLAIPDRHSIITGLVRLPEHGIFRPDNVAEKGEWWMLDLDVMSDFWGFSSIEPAVIYAENAAFLDDGQEPYPVPTQLKNDHSQYAFFWFTMAGILCVFWWLRFLRPYLQSA